MATTKKVINMTERSLSNLAYNDYLYLTKAAPATDERLQASTLRDFILSGIKTVTNSGLKQTATPYGSSNPEYTLELDANNLDIATGTIGAGDYIVIEAVGSGLTKKMTAANVLAGATSAVTSVNGGDGITVSPTTGATAVEVDLKANGGLVIESGEVAVDLAASSITGTLADSDIASAATWNAKQNAITDGAGLSFTGDTLEVLVEINGGLDFDVAGDAGKLQVSRGISQYNVAQFDTGVVDNDFLRINGTAVEGRSASEVLSDIGAQATLAFGIADTNAVKIDSASVANNDYAKFTANGLEGRTASEVKTDLSLDNVENTALSSWAGSTNITSTGTLTAGFIEGESTVSTGVLSTGVTGTAKFLRADGDNSSSWQIPPDTNTTYTAGDGLDLSVGNEFSTDLKANGGIVIESTELALDIGASSITGTLAVDDGGTGQTSYTNGQLLIGNTTGNTLTKATLTAGSNITITEGAGSITIAAASGGDPAGTAVAMAIALGG